MWSAVRTVPAHCGYAVLHWDFIHARVGAKVMIEGADFLHDDNDVFDLFPRHCQYTIEFEGTVGVPFPVQEARNMATTSRFKKFLVLYFIAPLALGNFFTDGRFAT